ncbi:MAG: NADPH-dependent FMN reductase [Paenibacillaceae bacterium]|jgi:Predicted flavoprotein|nr:MAG: NADPH-dependent FMN reductase [Paenibacillaceae bacterium]
MHIAIIAGSNRRNAASTGILRHIERKLGAKGIRVSFFDLGTVHLPLFSPDAEAVPPEAGRLIASVDQADGLVLGTPEYHGSISGSLKNALDYLDNVHVAGKPVLAVSSAGGKLGVSSLNHLQAIVRNLHGILSPDWISVGDGQHVFDRDGIPQDPAIAERIDQAVEQFVGLARKLRTGSAEPAGAVTES